MSLPSAPPLSTTPTLLTPGPVPLHPEVQAALALDMIHHRTPEFDAILARVLRQLSRVFETQQPVMALSSTGSGGMEALLVNTLSPGDLVLSVDSGKFGERWAEMAKNFGARVETLKVDWGHAVKVGEVAGFLKQNPETKAVLCQACETSTGTLHPIRELGELIHHTEALFLVDGITAVGALPLPMDQWHIDGLVGGSQKAFMLPTGMSFVSLSKKAWQAQKRARMPRFYFDLQKELAANQKGETYFSSNVTLIRALDISLRWILDQCGLQEHLLSIERRAVFTRRYAHEMGLQIFTQAPSNSLTAIRVPEGIDGQALRLRLEEKYRVTVMGGQDQLKGKVLRIGHMGYLPWHNLQKFFDALPQAISELSPQWRSPRDLDSLRLEMQGFTHHA